MATSGREVLRGPLLHRRKGNSSWKRRLVLVHCGSQVEGKERSALIYLHGDYEKPGHKPKKVLELAKAKIETSSNTPPGSHTSSPNTMGTSPYISSPPNFSTSPPSSGSSSEHLFQIIIGNETNEFKAENEEDRLRWVKLLGLLVMFPYSAIPLEPEQNPIKDTFRFKLNPKAYGADSVWAVYILPEEVGSRCHIIGTMVLALKSGIPNTRQVGRLDIINPLDPSTPIVSWDQDKLRRTGKTGNLVFIEIGRRCQGGPGLVWMYAGFEEAQALRQTLHQFLFCGDGNAVAIPTRPYSGVYDVPRPSFDSHPHSRSNSLSGSCYATVPGPIKEGQFNPSVEADSGYLTSTMSTSLSRSPHSLDEPPPVRLDKHPSIRKKRSAPRDIKRRASRDSPASSYNDKDGMSGRSVDSLDQATLFGEHDGSNSPPSSEPVVPNCYPIGQVSFSRRGPDRSNSFAEDIAGDMEPEPESYYDVPRRSNSAPMAWQSNSVEVVRRSHSASESGPSRGDYETMVHPNAGILQDGYVMMRPSELRSQLTSHPIAIGSEQQVSQSLVPQPATQLPSPPGAETSASPRSRLNYDRLPPIREGQPVVTTAIPVPPQPSSLERQLSNYENHPLPAEVMSSESVVYQPSYENVSMAQSGRRGSQVDDQYENVTVTGEQIRRGSFRRSLSGDKEDVRLPLKGNGLTIGGHKVSPPNELQYAELSHGELTGGHTHPTVKHVDYAKIDVARSDAIRSLSRKRTGELQRGLSGLQLQQSM